MNSLWAKIKRIDDLDNIIIPHYLDEINNSINLEYGSKSIKVYKNIYNIDDINYSFNKPIIIYLSGNIIDKLLINIDITYQMNYQNNTISIGPIIGILMGEQHYYYHDKHIHELTESMINYENIGGLYYVFKISGIDYDKEVIYGLYYNNSIKKWLYSILPIPSVIFIRGFQNNKIINKLKKLTNNKVFNSLRLDKWIMYQKMLKNKVLLNNLPDTIYLDNYKSLKIFINKHKNIILKPSNLSRGRGIYFIDKINDYYLVSGNDYKNKKMNKYNLYNFLSKELFFKRNYIAQKKISLATVNKSPFDIRVVMQKNIDNIWNCSGIECRIAGKEDIITNIARGGQALSLDETIKLAFGVNFNHNKVRDDIIKISMLFCHFADSLNELFAEFGLDIAIDKDGKYWFIEANVRPTFKGFKTLDYNNYLFIISNPIIYAASLAGFRKEFINV